MAATEVDISAGDAEAAAPEYRQTIRPVDLEGTLATNDTDTHDYRVDARGKAKMTVAVDNPANQAVTVTVYGLNDSASVVADTDTQTVGSFTVSNASRDYQTVSDPFPFYMVRLAHTVAPTNNPILTRKVQVHLVS